MLGPVETLGTLVRVATQPILGQAAPTRLDPAGIRMLIARVGTLATLAPAALTARIDRARTTAITGLVATTPTTGPPETITTTVRVETTPIIGQAAIISPLEAGLLP
jgi:hypothetical protein